MSQMSVSIASAEVVAYDAQLLSMSAYDSVR